jgi:hypothetical protein
MSQPQPPYVPVRIVKPQPPRPAARPPTTAQAARRQRQYLPRPERGGGQVLFCRGPWPGLEGAALVRRSCFFQKEHRMTRLTVSCLGFAALAVVIAWGALGNTGQAGTANSGKNKPAQGPIPPTNPLKIGSDVGSAATERGKVMVSVEVTVTKNAVNFRTILIDRGTFSGGMVELDSQACMFLVEALTATLAKPDADYSKKGGKLRIENKEIDNKRIISVLEDRFLESPILLDRDNAETLVKLLRKAQGVQEWIKDRASAFQK